MGKFDLKQLLSQSSLENQDVKSVDKEFKVELLNIYDLIPASNEENFYSVTDFKELKESIEMFGIQQNLVVNEIGEGKYKVIAGHRRRLAALELTNEGKKEFEYVPCIVKKELDYVSEGLLLIMTNSTTRVLSDWEKVKQCIETEKLLIEYRKNNKIPGRTRDLVSEILDTSPSNVARMKAIHNNLNDDLKEEFKNNNINISTAYELSASSNDIQEKALEALKEKESLTINDVKELKKSEEALKPIPGQITIEEVKRVPEEDASINEIEKDNKEIIEEKTNEDAKDFNDTEEDHIKEEVKSESVKEEKEIKCIFCYSSDVIKTENYKIRYVSNGAVGICNISDEHEYEFVTIAYCPLCGRKL